MRIFRTLREDTEAVRNRIQSLRQNPYPDDVIVLPGEPDEPEAYEVFESGYWIGYSVDESNPAETTITIWGIEAN